MVLLFATSEFLIIVLLVGTVHGKGCTSNALIDLWTNSNGISSFIVVIVGLVVESVKSTSFLVFEVDLFFDSLEFTEWDLLEDSTPDKS